MTVRSYNFHAVERCEMCHAPKSESTILGLRLDGTQGLNPRGKSGIAVTVRRCKQCDFTYADPEPRPAALTDHYGVPPEEYWSKEQLTVGLEEIARPFPKIKELVNFVPGMKALDVGTGIGKGFTALQLAGFDAWALEPSPPFHARALKLTGATKDRIVLASAEEAVFPENSFDVVTFGAVFEHLYDPSNLLERSLKWLRPGGIWYAEVPSVDHLLAKLINTYFMLTGTSYATNLSPMHPPYHIHEFSPRTFRNIGERVKSFELVHHYYEVCSIRHFPKFLHPILARVMEKTDTGMQLHVFLRRI